MIDFFDKFGPELITKSIEHFQLSMTSLLIGCLIAIPLGIMISRSKRISTFIIGITSILQTIPSLALLAIMVPLFGVGKTPAIAALVIYSLLPILRNTVLGMQAVDPDTMDAAKGMGMNTLQQIFKVQLPLSQSVLASGVRLSATYVVAWTTLASYVGAGGLGDFIFSGLNTYNIELIVWGTLAIGFLTLIIDVIFGFIEKRFFSNSNLQTVKVNL